MNRRILITALGLLSFRLASAAQPPLTLTLDQALALAETQSVDLRLARLSLNEFQSLYRQAIGGALPDITLSGSYSRNVRRPVAFFPDGKIYVGLDNSFEGTLDLEQPLYSGGKVITGIKAAQHGVQGSQKNLEDTQAEVRLSVKSMFYAALLSSANASIQADNLASAQEHLDTIRQRYRQGLDSDLTVRRQEVEVASARATLIRSDNFREVALLSLQDLLALDVDRPLQVQGVLAPPRAAAPSYEAVSQQALLHNSGLQAAREQTQFYFRLVDIAVADMKPQLSLFGRVQWVAQSQDFSPTEPQRATAIAGGARLSYPVFTGGSHLEKVRQARILYERAHEQELRLERRVRVDVRRQWLEVGEALERARSQEEAIEQARQALRATEIRYKAGQASQLELNDATVALNQVRTRFILAAHDYWVSLAALERATGGPLPGAQP